MMTVRMKVMMTVRMKVSECDAAVCPGREVPDLWDVGSITPLFNQTVIEGPHRG